MDSIDGGQQGLKQLLTSALRVLRSHDRANHSNAPATHLEECRDVVELNASNGEYRETGECLGILQTHRPNRRFVWFDGGGVNRS
jgi:hypothetical protein